MRTSIEDEFKRSMDQLRFSAGTKDLMCQKLIYLESEGRVMKKQNLRKTAAALAVCALALGGTVFGAVKSGVLYGWSHSSYDFAEVEEAVASEDFAADANLPESFANGFTFDGGQTMFTSDESGKQWEDLSLTYKDGNDRTVSALLVKKEMTGEDRKPTEAKIIQGVEVRYNLDEYLFIPPDYDPGAEVREREKTDPHFYVSEGSKEPETVYYRSVNFTKDGIYYLLQTSDDVKAGELFSMATEIIG